MNAFVDQVGWFELLMRSCKEKKIIKGDSISFVYGMTSLKSK